MTGRRFAWAAGLCVLAAGNLAGAALAAFGAQTSTAANRVAAAPDFRAPTVSASVIVRSGGSTAGYVKPGGTYFVYANATDTGNPASGVASVTANVSSVTPGQPSAPLSAGSFTAGGVSYGYRSASLVAGAVAEGAKTYAITPTDVAGNSAQQTGFSVTVDATPPTGVDVQSANGGATAGTAEAGDTITYTYSEPVEPTSILAGWNGQLTTVVVRLTNGTLIPTTNDGITVFDPTDTTPVALGGIDLGRTDYVLLGDTRFRTAGSPSRMVMAGNTVTVTLGALNGLGINLGAGAGTMRWTPSATAIDRAANAASTTPANETGAADREF
jgi:hypothetical protein